MTVCYCDFQINFLSCDFRTLKVTLDPNNINTKQLIENAKSRFKGINFNKVDSSGAIRDDDEIKYKSFSGLIVEQVCLAILNKYNRNPNITIELDESNTSINQVDLRIKKQWCEKDGQMKSVEKTIEVRASFPCNIGKAISENFDVLGPYHNSVKNVSENEKDFYLRFLYDIDYSLREYTINNKNEKINFAKTATNLLKNMYFDQDLNLKEKLTVYFVGGATREMMSDPSLAYLGKMTSENFNQDSNALFKKIKIRNSLDGVAILRPMLGCIINEKKEEK